METRESFGDENLLRELASRVSAVQQDLENFKNEFAKWMKEI